MPIEKSSAMEASDTAPSGEETQAKGAADSIEELKRQVEERLAGIQQAAADVERKRQGEADMAGFKRQLRAVDEAKAAARTYTVQSGDSLSAIALSVYGDAGRWPEIFEANKDLISNPNLIHPGQELRIP
ncbi:MAG: LysM peptidoglycan-binding domain-containing protein [Chloroflexota bacterium]|nr:LysM peptidoglycan-binding domain-containing protein [Chloroflexota bacterium]